MTLKYNKEPFISVLYSNIAVSLNDWENYKHQRTYENWLVLKLILFKFVNSFLALFYIAFYLQDFDVSTGPAFSLPSFLTLSCWVVK